MILQFTSLENCTVSPKIWCLSSESSTSSLPVSNVSPSELVDFSSPSSPELLNSRLLLAVYTLCQILFSKFSTIQYFLLSKNKIALHLYAFCRFVPDTALYHSWRKHKYKARIAVLFGTMMSLSLLIVQVIVFITIIIPVGCISIGIPCQYNVFSNSHVYSIYGGFILTKTLHWIGCSYHFAVYRLRNCTFARSVAHMQESDISRQYLS